MPKPHGGRLVDRSLKGERRDRIEEEAKALNEIELREGSASNVENIARGIFSPLEGFLCHEDYESVLDEKRLADDLPWIIPIVLNVSKEIASPLKERNDIALYHNGKPLAILHLEEKFAYSKRAMTGKIFGTLDKNHPGVMKIYDMDEVLLGGKIDLLNEIVDIYTKYSLSPLETRILFREKGWRTIAGFQTRNAPHQGHEYMQKTALSFVDGVFINPVIGRKKKGDFKDEVILEAYDALISNYYLKERAVLGILRSEMRYAGPREAIFHAIVRKNFGCTHFIIGRDHAGVDGYYPPYDAQKIFEEFPDLGIMPLSFSSFFYCKRCGGVANEKICPHEGEDRINFSGTRIREWLLAKQFPPREVVRPEVAEIILRWNNPFVE